MIKAEHDLRSARNDMNDVSPITELATFHCQQCIEKCFKAVLVSRLKHIHKSHYLPFLLEECIVEEPELTIFIETANNLFPYAVTSRYPDDSREISFEVATEAMVQTESAFRYI